MCAAFWTPRAAMERIERVTVGLGAAPPYLQPLSVRCRQNGTERKWDFMKMRDSVTILLFNSSQRSLVLVKQFRPDVYMSEVERRFPGFLATVNTDEPQALPMELQGSVGVVYELCEGVVDVPGEPPEEVACHQALEKCRYLLSPYEPFRVATYKVGVGLTGSTQTMFYAEVTDAQNAGPSRVEQSELIEAVHLPLKGAQAFSDNPRINKNLSVISGISWFLQSVLPGLDLQ